MITGFNTDIDFDGVTYHVQTEDKGLDTPLILSLVYQHGTILASKRSPYEDLIADGFDESVLTERLQRQHKLICAAIKAGRIEDLKRMTMKNSSNSEEGLVVKKETKKASKTKSAPKNKQKPMPRQAQKDIPSKPQKKASKPRKEKTTLLEDTPASIKMPTRELNLNEESVWDVPITAPKNEVIWDIPVIEDVEVLSEEEIFEEEIILSADAVEVVNELIEVEEIIRDELQISFLKDYEFKSGDKKDISVVVYRGDRKGVVDNARVMVKILGADFRPMIFHAKTNEKGIATVLVKLPNFRSGRAAVLVRAIIDGEEIELRKVISQK